MVQSFTWLIASALVQQPSTAPAPLPPSPPASFEAFDPVSDSGRPRPKAIEFSDAYYTRLTIHRYASYTMLPLFAAEYALGQSMYNQNVDSIRLGSTRSWHGLVANAIGALFIVNTVTGVWNLWEGRKATEGRTRRYVHAGLMLLSDAGFAYTASLAPGRRNFETGKVTHKEAAMISIGTAVVGDLMMLIWNKK
jgi:hypothetical protein